MDAREVGGPGGDLLGAVLRELRFESAACRWLELGAPFRVGFDLPRLHGVHLVTGSAPPGPATGAGVDPTAHDSTPSRATCGTSPGPVATTT